MKTTRWTYGSQGPWPSQRAADGTPLVARYDHDGDWGWNPNNHVKADPVLIVPRK